MRTTNLKTNLIKFSAVIALAILVTGCEDEIARAQYTKQKEEFQQVRDEMQELQAKWEKRTTEFDALRKSLRNRINERFVEIDDKVVKMQLELAQKIIDTNKKSSQTLLAGLQSMREDNDKRFKSVIAVDMAQRLGELRGELDKMRVEMIGYMDNQLKELYPYAYQPRRMDATKAPEEPQE